MARATTLEVEHHQTPEGALNRLVIHGRGTITTPATANYEFLHVGREEAAPHLLDGYLMGALHWAMAVGDPIVVRGPVSMTALRNAMSLMDVWACWAPGRYRRVDINPDLVVEGTATAGRPGPRRAIAAFSGGVDSTFTVLRHSVGSDLAWSHGVRDVVMVHGFDVPLSDVAAFDGLVSRTRPLLDSLGLQLHVVRTNVRAWPELDWEQTYGAQLGCVLHQFEANFDRGIIAAGPHYLIPFTPWGSSALTDPMLSGAAMSIVHDGAGFTRIPKVRGIAEFPMAMATVKVCWEGDRPDRNCGRCEKCLRTRLSFAAVGVSDPPCFDTPLRIADIETLQVPNEHGLADLYRIIDYCDTHGVEGDWLEVLRTRVDQISQSFVPGSRSARRRGAVRRARRILRRLRMRARRMGDGGAGTVRARIERP